MTTPRLEVELADRFSAVSLMERLARHHSYLVSPSSARWIVHARCSEEELDQVMAAVSDWGRARDCRELPLKLIDASA